MRTTFTYLLIISSCICIFYLSSCFYLTTVFASNQTESVETKTGIGFGNSTVSTTSSSDKLDKLPIEEKQSKRNENKLPNTGSLLESFIISIIGWSLIVAIVVGKKICNR